MFLYILSWIALIIQIIFLTLALAAALYYLAELIEEYTVLAAKLITYMIGIVTAIYLGLLLFEGFPYLLIAAGLLSNGTHYLLLKDFPFISLTSPVFLFGCVMVFVNHYLAFQHFASVWYPFSEVLAYFTLCLWLLPFAFFVSLSANENVLPTAATGTATDGSEPSYDYPGQNSSRRQGLLALFNFLSRKKDEYLPSRHSQKTY